ncbi:outer membrane protein assembly factor BamB family protein [Andreprevotia lacus]|jgi:hypothetical protein|nr:PQQ-binding-like beta-propeller repeat protein [Andreprevotia lacus]
MIGLALAGCGGGGGGGSSSGNGNTTSAVAFAPATIAATADGTQRSEVRLVATPSAELASAKPADIFIKVVDSNQVFSSGAYISSNGDGTFNAVMSTQASLAAGSYSGQLQVQLCKSADCASQYAGSPVSVPYRVNVGMMQPALTRWDGVADWSTAQGNAKHDGYVPVTLDPAKFSLRWHWTTPLYNPPSEPTIYNGTAVTSAGKSLIGLDENTGSQRWSSYFGWPNTVNSSTDGLASANGLVYVSWLATGGNGANNAQLLTFDIKTGSQLRSASYTDRFNLGDTPASRPTVDNGTVYLAGQKLTTVSANGVVSSYGPTLGYQSASVAVDGQNAYSYGALMNTPTSSGSEGELHVFDKNTGALKQTLPDAVSYLNWVPRAHAVVGAQNDIILVNPWNQYSQRALTRLNVGGGVAWSVRGDFNGQPVVANGKIHITCNFPTRVETYDEASGKLLWSQVLPYSNDQSAVLTFAPMIVTNNLLFVNGTTALYAIDLNSHRIVWQYPGMGTLALSANGLLYVTTYSGITAINLK